MDLALNEINMEGYFCPLETVLCQEETQEAIVPDACPDIRRVLCGEARAQLAAKSCVEGKLECSGDVRVTVVYLPDGEEGLRHMEVTVPFRCGGTGQVSPGCPTVVVPRVTGVDVRVLNPRKILCRVELAVSCQGWSLREETLCLPREDGEFALEQRVEDLETYTAMAVAEKTFAFTDDVTLPPSYLPAQELLGHRLELRCGEAKVIGSKLIFKGEVVLQCRYRGPDNVLALGRWELPFSQIMEVSGLEEEEGSCTVDVVERESTVELVDDGEGRTLSVHLDLLAQAVIRQTRQVRLFSDAYSITHDLTVERQSRELTQLWEDSAVNQVFRELLETPQAVGEVSDCAVTLGPCRMTRQDQEGVLTAQGRAVVLYTDDAGELQSMERTLELSVSVPLPAKGECRGRCALAGEVQAVAAAGGIELRVPVRFGYLTTVRHSRETVTALQVEEREEAAPRPSVRLRLVQPGEGLWEVAKACSATREDILAANDIPDPTQLAGAMLLIPTGR